MEFPTWLNMHAAGHTYIHTYIFDPTDHFMWLVATCVINYLFGLFLDHLPLGISREWLQNWGFTFGLEIALPGVGGNVWSMNSTKPLPWNFFPITQSVLGKLACNSELISTSLHVEMRWIQELLTRIIESESFFWVNNKTWIYSRVY